MSSLVLMYVYFDGKGNIKAITPNEDQGISTDYEYAMFPISEVEHFMTGNKNLFNFQVKKVKKASGDTYEILKKQTTIDLTRSLNNYLNKIETTGVIDPIIKIVANPVSGKVTLSMNEGFKELQTYGTVEEQEIVSDFFAMGLSNIYITAKNNPYHLLFSITFLTKQLFDEVRMDFTIPEGLDIRNSSAYTKKLVNSYCYIVKDVGYVV